MQDLFINLLASIIAGCSVWFGQRIIRYRQINRRRQFLGAWPGSEVFLFVPKHSSSPRPKSVHRDDVGAIVELATAIKECGARTTLISGDESATMQRTGTEFCVGGPIANLRTAAYMRIGLPGVVIEPYDPQVGDLSFRVGTTRFEHVPDQREYALLVRVFEDRFGQPVFLILGQKAHTNLETARYLVNNIRQLSRRYAQHKDLCLVLLVSEPQAFGTHHVEVVADVSAAALAQRHSALS